MPKVTVWFDGACPLCIREIALMKRLDSRDAICFVDLTEANTTCPLDRQLMLDRFHAEEDGVVLNGAAAFAAMWRAIPMLRPLGLMAKLPGVSPGLEFLYRVFLRIRPRLQRTVARGQNA